MCSRCNGGLTNKVENYISETRFIELATVNDQGRPEIRTLGSFATDGLTIYFSTSKKSAKVKQIDENPWVVVLFQHENQELPAYKNVTYYGKAAALENPEEFDIGVKQLSARNPRFKERVEKGQLGETIIFKIEPQNIKYLDFAAGSGPAAIKEIKF
jgi:Uncharacterized stress protein (general stress protein 26)